MTNPKNHGKEWTDGHLDQLKKLVNGNTQPDC